MQCAVCTHPDCHGGGYAAQLTSTVTSQMLARGKAAFLHAYATNTPAIVLAGTASQIRDPEPQTLRAA